MICQSRKRGPFFGGGSFRKHCRKLEVTSPKAIIMGSSELHLPEWQPGHQKLPVLSNVPPMHPFRKTSCLEHAHGCIEKFSIESSKLNPVTSQRKKQSIYNHGQCCTAEAKALHVEQPWPHATSATLLFHTTLLICFWNLRMLSSKRRSTIVHAQSLTKSLSWLLLWICRRYGVPQSFMKVH